MSESLILGTTSTGIRKKILVDSDGKLITSGGGGGGGGDASASNQLTQIGLETTIRDDTIIIKTESQTQTIVQEAINEKIDLRLLKCDTDNVIIDSSDPVQTVLLAKVENTLNNAFLNVDASQNLKVTVANQNDISTLATEETQTEIKTQLDKLTFTNNKLKVIEEPLITTEPIYLDFNNNSAQVIGDSPAGCWYNPLDDVEGWGYINETAGGAQVYYYTNTGLVPNASEPNITLGSVTTGWCVASLNLITTTDNTWIMGIYTKPTGSGDAQIWYKSRKSYQVTSSFPLSKGVDYLFYWGDDPTTVHPELQHVEMALASTQGPADPSEIVQFMSLNVPSTVPQNQFVGRVKRAGYVRSGVSREVHFLNSNKILTELKLQQLKFNTILPDLQAEAPLFVSLDNATYTTDEVSEELQLNVRDDKLSRELASLNSTVGQGLYINMETDPVVSGGVKLSGDATTKSLFVNVTNEPSVSVSNFPSQITGFSLESTQTQIKEQTDKLTFNENNELLVSSTGGSSGYPDVNLKCNDVLLTQTPDGTKNCLDVQINNQLDISTLATQETLNDLKTLVENQSAFNRFQTEATVTDGLLQNIQNNMSLTNFNVNNLTKCDTDNVAIPTGVNINNFPLSQSVSVSNFPTSTEISNFPQKQSVFVENTTEGFDINVNITNSSLAITTSTALDTNITNSSVDVHAYASSNGTIWHHLSSDSNGQLNVHSKTQDGVGNDITSTAVTGTETYTALDVKCRGTTTVAGGVNATLESGSGPLTSTVNDEINALDVQVQNIVNTNLRTSTGGLLTSTSEGTKNSLDVSIQNTSITAIQKSQPASVQTVLTNEICNCTGPADSRALTTSYDTTGFLYVSVVLNITNYSQSGFGSPSIYLQSSPDGVLWFNETSNSVYQNGAMKIQAYNVLTVPYVRLYLDCSSITSPNVIQFTISTALLCQK